MTRITLAYAGRRLGVRDTLLHCYVTADKPDDLMAYSKALMPGLKIGTEIEVDQDEQGRVLTGQRDVVGQTENDAAIVAWSTEDKVAQIQHARMLENRRRAKAGVDPLDESLEVLRQAYRGMSRGIGRRSAFIDYVTTYIQS